MEGKTYVYTSLSSRYISMLYKTIIITNTCTLWESDYVSRDKLGLLLGLYLTFMIVSYPLSVSLFLPFSPSFLSVRPSFCPFLRLPQTLCSDTENAGIVDQEIHDTGAGSVVLVLWRWWWCWWWWWLNDAQELARKEDAEWSVTRQSSMCYGNKGRPISCTDDDDHSET